MNEFPGYRKEEIICDTGEFVLYRCSREGSGEPVLLKVPLARHPSGEILRRIEHEYQAAHQLSSSLVVRPLEIVHPGGRTVLVLEDDRIQRPVSELLQNPMAADRFLQIGIGAAKSLYEIHQHGLIHKDIRPQNLFFNAETGRVRITGFEIASLLPQEGSDGECFFEGTLAYLSPEQTGRINRVIDHRSDFYSLGITFYQMLTDLLPFDAVDALEWIHCHIAQTPRPPSALLPDIPEPLSEIVMRLLAKAAEDRYQSAAGLQFDLEKCSTAWHATRHIEPFPLAERDFSERFEVPGKLYGRQVELDELLDAFDRVANGGRSEMALVSGGSGVGKSALVGELQGMITARRGFFTAAKFDQFKRDTSYSTIAEGFRELVRRLLAQSEERLALWKSELQAALGLNGQLIVDLIPELEWVVGSQPPVVALPLNQARSRFQLLFTQFLRVFATAEHPLVLFLDDLQWSDSSSFELLEYILADSGTRHLFLIAACRDSEVDPVHPLTLSVEKIHEAGTPVSDIPLGPFLPEDLSQLLAETLHCDPARIGSLAQLIYEKTGGNPFFVMQFLTTLEHEGLIAFDHQAAEWRWDIGGIEAQSHTDNMVEFMVGKLTQLPPNTRHGIHLASCLGHEASLSLLAAAAGKSELEVGADLREAFCEGLLLKRGDAYQFLHDQVRQAAYALESEEARQRTHLCLGRLLVSLTPREAVRLNVFQIVHQLNLGAPLIDSEEERLELARLNLAAGIRARESSAYNSAVRYLGLGITLLSEDAWESCPALAYDLHFEQAQCEYLRSHFEEALRQFRALRPHARSERAQAEIVRGEVDAHTVPWELDEAVDCGLQGLRSFGMEIDPHPSAEQIRGEYERIWRYLGNRPIAQLADLPTMTEARIEAVMLVLAALQPASYFSDRDLYMFCCCRMINLSIEHGNCPFSVIAYAALGAVSGAILGQYQQGLEFGRLSSELVERHGLLVHKAEVLFVRGGMIELWKYPLSNCLDSLQSGFKLAGEVGDLIFGCYCGIQTVLQKIVSGDALDKVFQESERYFDFTRKARSEASSQMLFAAQRFIRTMRGMTNGVATFDDATFREEPYETAMEGSRTPIVRCSYHILKMQARFIAGEFEQGEAAGIIARSLLWSVASLVLEFQYHYFQALTLAAQWRKGTLESASELLERLESHHVRLGLWAGNCAQTFSSAYKLVSAEIARIRGKDFEAAHLYEQAIREAHENGCISNEAVAYEVACRFYLECGFEVSARAYLRQSWECYARWGAEGKVRQLEERHPWLRERLSVHHGAVTAGQEQLDLRTVIKASQAISGQIDLPQLLDALLRIVLENAGAQKVVLLLAQNGGFRVAAMLEEGRSPPVTPSVVPESIIHYVLRTHEKVLLQDAACDARFSNDDYIVQEKPGSVLSVPMLSQNALVGVLYLENKLVAGAFTPERITVLELLASQAAISLKNAILYAELQQENHERKQAEEEVRKLNSELEERVERRTRQLRRSLEKEELLRKEVHHRVKNNLQVISSLLFLQSLDSRDPGTRELLRESQARTHSIALVHEKLYQSSDLKRIDFAVYARQLAASLIDSYHYKPGLIRLTVNAEGCFLSPDVAVPCGLIVNELLSNCLKYAFEKEKGGEIEVSFALGHDGLFRLVVRDNGRGFPEGFDPEEASTLGVRLVRDLTLQLNGNVEFRNEHGTVVDITFPASGSS